MLENSLLLVKYNVKLGAIEHSIVNPYNALHPKVFMVFTFLLILVQ